MSNQTEIERVTEHSRTAFYAEGVMQKATAYCCSIFKRYLQPGSLLELGPAEGVMTDLLAPSVDDYTVVDGAAFWVDDIIKRHPHIKGYASLFEDFKPIRQYDNIILGHVLEHVQDSVEILRLSSSWLSKNGVIMAAVPNSNSIHRQAAVLMGLLETEKQLNETDKKNGHRRVYDIDTLERDFVDAGLKIINRGGYWIKPEHNAFINAHWSENMVDAFLQLGERYPDIAAEIYVIAQR